jgi:hypothetical protein
MTEPRPPLALEVEVSRFEYGDALAAQISSAISLKRIADLLERVVAAADDFGNSIEDKS